MNLPIGAVVDLIRPLALSVLGQYLAPVVSSGDPLATIGQVDHRNPQAHSEESIQEPLKNTMLILAITSISIRYREPQTRADYVKGSNLHHTLWSAENEPLRSPFRVHSCFK